MKGYIVKGDVIEIGRELNELDFFVKDFLEVLKKHCDYLVVSGFVSISTGRTRGTEDVDLLIPKLKEDAFRKLFEDLIDSGFWCYQGDSSKEVYEYIENMESIRFARKEEMFPNMEVIPIDESRKAKYFEFNHPQKIKIDDFNFKIPPIEFEILYKEIMLGGKKDLEDAQHLRVFFEDFLNEDKFNEYKEVIENAKNE